MGIAVKFKFSNNKQQSINHQQQSINHKYKPIKPINPSNKFRIKQCCNKRSNNYQQQYNRFRSRDKRSTRNNHNKLFRFIQSYSNSKFTN